MTDWAWCTTQFLICDLVMITCTNAFQIDIPTLVTETLGREGLKHLEIYLRAKEKGC